MVKNGPDQPQMHVEAINIKIYILCTAYLLEKNNDFKYGTILAGSKIDSLLIYIE